MPPLIELRNVSKRYWLRKNRSGELKVRFLGLLHNKKREIRDELWALRDVSFSVGPGESLGLIGRNGSGKSTLLKLVAGIHRPTLGHVSVRRGIQIGTLIELGIGFHMELSGRENVHLNAAIHGMTAAQIAAIYPSVVEYSGLRDFMDVQLKNYSSGMQMRLAFAVAANLDPDVLLLDEIFAVGDEEFQKQCRRTIEQFLAAGKTILFVSHSSASVRDVCQRVCLLEHGRLLYDGPVDGGLEAYQRLMLSPPTPLESGAPPPRAASMPGEGAVAEATSDAGARQFDFLRAQGLSAADYVLEVSCGCGPVAERLAGFLEDGHGFALDADEGRFELGALPPITIATAFDVFATLPREAVGRCIASVVRGLTPDGRFFATVTPEDEAQIVAIAAVAGARAERVEGWSGDGGQMLVLRTKT
jgi:ABC-type polysaccharide/polyol phosphate transport system ATPase subunit